MIKSSALSLGLLLFGLAQAPRAEAARVHVRPTKVVVGYVLDDPDATDLVNQLDLSRITHLDIAFANPKNAAGDLSVPTHLNQLVALAHQHKVKVLISIGGGDASESASKRQQYFGLISPSSRTGFVAKLVRYVEVHKLDGLDVDLEGAAINKDYEAFVRGLHRALKGKLLTAAVSSGNGGDQITSDALRQLDYVNVMAYDATGPWEPNHPGQHSSMETAKEQVSYWVGRGVPKPKLLLGLPFYGYGFGEAFTKGGYTYAEIVAKFPGSERSDQVAKTIWYNGIPTIKAKTQFVMDQGLGGVMIWSIDQDAKGKLSLLYWIQETLNGKS